MKTKCTHIEKILNTCLIIFILSMLGYLYTVYPYLSTENKIYVDYSGDQLSDYEPLIIAKHFPKEK